MVDNWPDARSKGLAFKGQLLDNLKEPTGQVMDEMAINSKNHVVFHHSSPPISYQLYDASKWTGIVHNQNLYSSDNACAAIFKINHKAKKPKSKVEENFLYEIKRDILHFLHMDDRIQLIGADRGSKLYEYASPQYSYIYRFHVPSDKEELDKLGLSQISHRNRESYKRSRGNFRTASPYSEQTATTFLKNFIKYYNEKWTM
ncbi:hypothetical protein MO973_25365 [Paenibacillus sp. TRM 82003]|nr:hypothetical protein [Paenibacillus sp. TRM 82003]